MATRILTTPTQGGEQLLLRLAAATPIHVRIRTLVDADEASITLTGEAEVLDRVRATRTASTWTVTSQPLVGPGDAVVSTGSVTAINGCVSLGGQIEAEVVLPAGSDLAADIDAGHLAVHGELSVARAEGAALSVEVEEAVNATVHTIAGNIGIGRAHGDIDAQTHAGNITINATGERTRACSHAGDVAVTAGSEGPIEARSHDGDVTVDRGRYRPEVQARTHAGRERII